MDHYLKIYTEAMDAAEKLKATRSHFELLKNDPHMVIKTTTEMNELYKTAVMALRSMQELKALNSAKAQTDELLDQLRKDTNG